MKLLLEGRIDSADFSTGYMHAQGLPVPLTGTITLVEEAASPTPSALGRRPELAQHAHAKLGAERATRRDRA
jgi:hypothetical protein